MGDERAAGCTGPLSPAPARERQSPSYNAAMNNPLSVDGIDRRPRAIFLMGPTASGKTQLACALADHFPVELISVDSALVYRGMDVGTAKPDAATLTRYPHRLVDIRDPAEPYSVADFREDALRAMDDISSRGRIPLLVGGTSLYFRGLERGLSELPPADAATRADLAAEAAEHGWQYLHARLHALDPVAAGRIRAGDTQRIQRALEVIALSGKTLTAQHGVLRARLPWRLLKLALMPRERAPLHARIAQRFESMLEQGLLQEAEHLYQRGLSPELPALRAVGYRQALEFLRGEVSREQLLERGIHATRQLAKRQMTWLRSELDARLFDPDDSAVLARVEAAVTAFLAAPAERTD